MLITNNGLINMTIHLRTYTSGEITIIVILLTQLIIMMLSLAVARRSLYHRH